MWSKILVVTDLDGTLLSSQRTLSERNREILEKLRAKGARVVVATGRSLHAARKVMGSDFPCDYLVTSTGAGIFSWPQAELLWSKSFEVELVPKVLRFLKESSVDFMIHQAVPDNHQFLYWRGSSHDNLDFHHRCEHYRAFGAQMGMHPPKQVSQFLVVDPSGNGEFFEKTIHAVGKQCSVVRATSPLDGVSTWVEIFPLGVSKATASEWLKSFLSLNKTLAIGNDYNDADLLDWADHAFIVGNGVKDLAPHFPRVASNDHDGVAEAIEKWLAMLKLSF